MRFAEVQGQHFGFVVAERRKERGSALSRRDDGGAGFADHVQAVIVAGAIRASAPANEYGLSNRLPE